MPDADSNGRVTLSVIGNKLDNIADKIDGVCQQIGDHEIRLRYVEKWGERSQERWVQHETKHKEERTLATVLGGIATTVASAVGVFVNKP